MEKSKGVGILSSGNLKADKPAPDFDATYRDIQTLINAFRGSPSLTGAQSTPNLRGPRAERPATSGGLVDGVDKRRARPRPTTSSGTGASAQRLSTGDLLRKKLEHLRQNSDELAALQNAVKEQRRAVGAAAEAVRERRAMGATLAERMRRYEELNAMEVRRQELAAERRARLQAELDARRDAARLREAELEIRAQRAAEEARAREHIQDTQKRWLTLMVHAIRVSRWWSEVVRGRDVREMNKTRGDAARKIQKWWRPRAARLRMLVFAQAYRVIRQPFYNYLLRFRARRRGEAVEIVKSFLKSLGQQRAVILLVKRFHFQVRRCQKYVRAFLSVHRARLAALGKLWDRCVAETESKGVKEPEKGSAEKDKGKPKKPSSLHQVKKPKRRASVLSSIPEAIKWQLLQQYLHTQRRAFRRAQSRSWMLQEELTGASSTYRYLPTPLEMQGLIADGKAQATTLVGDGTSTLGGETSGGE
eukprot:tig00021357_g20762.t1